MEIKNLREYYDVYVQRETSLLADVFENFWNVFLQLDSAHSLSTPDLPLQAALKETKVKLDLSAEIDKLFIKEKVLEVEYSTLYIDI